MTTKSSNDLVVNSKTYEFTKNTIHIIMVKVKKGIAIPVTGRGGP
jgi:hypothetical protein